MGAGKGGGGKPTPGPGPEDHAPWRKSVLQKLDALRVELGSKLDIVSGLLNQSINLQSQLLQREVVMAATLDDVQAQVSAQTTVVGGAVTLLQGLKAALDAAIASGDMSKVQAISDGIGVNTQTLSDAVVANTPAGPPA